MYRKILVPLDGSELAEKALDHAEKLAETFAAEIILFQVVPFMPVFGGTELMPFAVDDEQKEAAERYLTTCAAELKRKGFKVTAKVMTGLQVAAEIIDFAKENALDLIVMCTHGHSGITLRVLGSVARKVFALAETPVLLIHPRK